MVVEDVRSVVIMRTHVNIFDSCIFYFDMFQVLSRINTKFSGIKPGLFNPQHEAFVIQL